MRTVLFPFPGNIKKISNWAHFWLLTHLPGWSLDWWSEKYIYKEIERDLFNSSFHCLVKSQQSRRVVIKVGEKVWKGLTWSTGCTQFQHSWPPPQVRWRPSFSLHRQNHQIYGNKNELIPIQGGRLQCLEYELQPHHSHVLGSCYVIHLPLLRVPAGHVQWVWLERMAESM